MANGRFEAYVRGEAAKRKIAMFAIKRESAQRLVEIMQEPGPSVGSTKIAIKAGAGLGKVRANGSRGNSKRAFGPVSVGGSGHMPVDTGFLRASLEGAIGRQTPTLRGRPEDRSSFTYDPGQITLVIANAKIADPITVAYGANYAQMMELRYRFVGLAAQQWQATVNAVTLDANARMK